MTLLLGDETVYSSGNFTQAGGNPGAWKYAALASGTVTELGFRTDARVQDFTSMALGIYADASGVPGALLGSGSVAKTGDGTSQWVTVTGLSINVTLGTSYWLAALPVAGLAHGKHGAFTDGNPNFTFGDDSDLTALDASFVAAPENTSEADPVGFRALGSVATPTVRGEPTYEVRLTPLIDSDSGGENAEIDLVDTDLVEQFADVDVVHPLSGGKTGSVVLSTADPLTASLEPWQQALWIGMIRAGNTVAEAIFHAPCNVITDYDAGTVTLIGTVHEKLQHHYVVQGDDALEGTTDDPETGIITWDGDGIALLLDAAQNTAAQVIRNMPDLGIVIGDDSSTSHPFYAMGIERGQEVYALIQSVASSAAGPDLDWRTPADGWPVSLYSYLDVKDTVGRDLSPADVDDVQFGEVLFGYGFPEDNLEGFTETPGRPTTHAHFLDADRRFRRTAAHIDSSALVGAWVDFVVADMTVPDVAASDLLLEMARARVNAYGVPPKFMEITLRPDAVIDYLYGHPTWNEDHPDGEGQTNGKIYPGDTVYLRAKRDYREYTGPARITEIRLSRPGSNGLSQMTLKLHPVVDGTELDEGGEG